MGTNYYLEIDYCKECGRPKTEIHLGKTSNDEFIFHQQNGLNDLKQMKKLITKGVIKDEYDRIISKEIFFNILDTSELVYVNTDFC